MTDSGLFGCNDFIYSHTGEGHTARWCRRVAYPESYITKYTTYTKNMARVRTSKPDSGRGFQVKVLKASQGVHSSLCSGKSIPSEPSSLVLALALACTCRVCHMNQLSFPRAAGRDGGGGLHCIEYRTLGAGARRTSSFVHFWGYGVRDEGLGGLGSGMRVWGWLSGFGVEGWGWKSEG